MEAFKSNMVRYFGKALKSIPCRFRFSQSAEHQTELALSGIGFTSKGKKAISYDKKIVYFTAICGIPAV